MKRISTIIAGLVLALGIGVSLGAVAFAEDFPYTGGPGRSAAETQCEQKYTDCKDSNPGGADGKITGTVYDTSACDSLPSTEKGACLAQGEGMSTNLMGTIKTIINTVLMIVGLISVAFLIYGGVQYTTSAGQAEKVKNAKNTIMYAIIGLVVSILAFAIVNFILKEIK
jgi:hypothetical protein